MFNGTKQNVVASSDYECLIWGMKETGSGEVKEENVTLERVHNSRASRGGGGKLGVWVQGFLDAQPRGPLAEKAGSWQAPCCRFGEDMVLILQVWKH